MAGVTAQQQLERAIDKITKMIHERCEDLQDMGEQAMTHGARDEAEEIFMALGELDDMAEKIENGEWRKVRL